MEAEQVIEKIMADAKGEADKIMKQAAEKEAAEQAALAGQLDEYNKQTQILADKAGQDEKAHILATARMETAKEYLAEKRKILDEVFKQARQRLLSLPDDQYRGLVAKLMLEAVETGEEEILVDGKDSRINEELISQVNEKLGPDRKGNLKLSDEKMEIGGGFVLRRDRVKTNVSVDILLDQARKEMEIELAKDLFS